MADADPEDSRVAEWAGASVRFAEAAARSERAAGIEVDSAHQIPDPTGDTQQLALAALESGDDASPAQRRAMALYLDHMMADHDR
ncbi:hypothetical protein [Nocardia yunnanensis]|uniref:hypothetical protein n=1 Tax=Nocardia yunnanensis TaxID=2382165 RepID=UPI001FE54ED3|nr:hypothetical protein [Nocardia yunnanensis]